MPSQVRIFTVPKSLDETLAQPVQAEGPPRSVPIYPDIPRPSGILPKIKPNTMALYHDKPAKSGITFAHQEKLPKLPIPDLEQSCQRYLTALKPLQTVREHAETRYAVHDFLRHDGPELQEKLKQYAEKQTSYIEQFCEPFVSRPLTTP